MKFFYDFAFLIENLVQIRDRWISITYHSERNLMWAPVLLKELWLRCTSIVSDYVNVVILIFIKEKITAVWIKKNNNHIEHVCAKFLFQKMCFKAFFGSNIVLNSYPFLSYLANHCRGYQSLKKGPATYLLVSSKTFFLLYVHCC